MKIINRSIKPLIDRSVVQNSGGAHALKEMPQSYKDAGKSLDVVKPVLSCVTQKMLTSNMIVLVKGALIFLLQIFQIIPCNFIPAVIIHCIFSCRYCNFLIGIAIIAQN